MDATTVGDSPLPNTRADTPIKLNTDTTSFPLDKRSLKRDRDPNEPEGAGRLKANAGNQADYHWIGPVDPQAFIDDHLPKRSINTDHLKQNLGGITRLHQIRATFEDENHFTYQLVSQQS
jgi:hypothetical protein